MDVRRETTILVVDDGAARREFLAWTLRSELGVRTHVAADADEAVRATRSTAPDLVLLVLVGPGADGLAVARRLREDPARRDVPVVALSARSDGLDPATLCDEVVPAPCAVEALVDRVRERLGAGAGA
jgi:CheY-like chemotaxis protein